MLTGSGRSRSDLLKTGQRVRQSITDYAAFHLLMRQFVVKQAPADLTTSRALTNCDLRISHIKSFVTSLRRLDVNWDEETRRDFFAEIELETDRLADLVEAWFTNVEHGSVS